MEQTITSGKTNDGFSYYEAKEILRRITTFPKIRVADKMVIKVIVEKMYWSHALDSNDKIKLMYIEHRVNQRDYLTKKERSWVWWNYLTQRWKRIRRQERRLESKNNG